MPASRETVTVNVVVEMTAASLQAIVANAKALATPDARGRYPIDTADRVGEMISRFLLDRDFEGFVRDIANFTP